MLEPVRESFRTGKPIEWTRVHDVPDFVYFNHSIHVAKGVGCESCHGRVDKMPLMRRAHSLQMGWCLECHRHPEHFVREPDEIYAFGKSGATTTDEATQLMLKLKIDTKQLTDCGICHR